MKPVLFTLVFILGAVSLSAQSFWSFIGQGDLPESGGQRILSFEHRLARFNLEAAAALLVQDGRPSVRLSVPMPDGSAAWFDIWETPVMPDALQAHYPQIRCFTGQGVTDASALLKCDLTPQGFHAMILSPQHSPVFIDVYEPATPSVGVVYFKKDYQRGSAPRSFSCGLQEQTTLSFGQKMAEVRNLKGTGVLQGDCMKRTYRLALACTGEYAIFHGGTKALALAAMNTTMNRVNGVYEKDLGVTMRMVPKNDTLIFLNANTDPYTNNDGEAQLDENVTVCNARIGEANYDIGHVFSTDAGGIAGLGVVCGSAKAQGATGGPSPVGDPFDIDYVVHEMGHQFGATHTQNNNCARSGNSSMEPGSGSTIMGYAGICAPNVQNFGEDYFHAISLEQIGQFVTLGGGNTCGEKLSTGNRAPVVSAGADYTIPRSTPFALTANGSDADGDLLTYCWEQMDPEAGTMPPAASNTVGPMFRSVYPTVNPVRTFPRLQDLSANITPTWERLPNVARLLKFRVTVRDNRAGGSCTAEDDLTLTVTAGAGPFAVTVPNTNVSWTVGTTQTVTWNVASTQLAPVNCSQVRIRLSTDAGLTYPVVLANSVPNTGTAGIVVPNFISSNCRVRVEAIGNVFFDISNVNFSIVAATTPTFLTSVAPLERTVCVGSTAEYVLQVSNVLTFSDSVKVSVTGAPAGATVRIQPEILRSFPATVTVQLSDFTNAQSGNYSVQIAETSGAVTRTAVALLTVSPAAPVLAAALLQPADAVKEVSSVADFQWSAVPFATRYTLEISTSRSFSGATRRISTPVNVATGIALDYATVYYWRVSGGNLCGDGPYSEVFSFQTDGATCGQIFNSTDVPKTIASATASTVVSSLPISMNDPIVDVNVSMKINHTWTGDLTARLIAPNNTAVVLFDRPGEPASQAGCDGDNIDAGFDDEAVVPYTAFELSCGDAPAIQGSFQPSQALRVFKGLRAGGNWRLSVRDNESEDGGSIESWSLSFCTLKKLPEARLLRSGTLVLAVATSAAVDTSLLRMASAGKDDRVIYTLTGLPRHGVLQNNGQMMGIGATFSQAAVARGLIRYTHNGDTATADVFRFQALDDSTKAWLSNGTFAIRIVQNTLTATAVQTAPVLCTGGATAAITATPGGAAGPYLYALNGGAAQNANVFTGLPAGTYTVTVTGAFGFTATAGPVVIREPLPLQATALVSVNTIVAGAAGGTAPYQYSVGQGFQQASSFDMLANGSYVVTVRDGNGCTDTTHVVVAVNGLSVVLVTVQTPLCKGDKNGSIRVNAAGGQEPYLYSLNGGVFQGDPFFKDVPAGQYTATVRDAQGFERTTNVLVLSDPDLLSVTATVQLNRVVLAGSGGTGILQYALEGGALQMSGVFTALANGLYTGKVRDANGCTATVGFSIEVPPLMQQAQIAASILCAGEKTGILVSAATGGIAPYQYSLNGGIFQDQPRFEGLGAGIYRVTVRDQAGMQRQDTLVLTGPAPISVQVVTRFDTVQVVAAGGTGSFLYSLDSTTFQGGTTFLNVANGSYRAFVRDANSCIGTTSFSVQVAPLAATPRVVQGLLCKGSADGRVRFVASGGFPPYQFRLNGGAFQDGNTFENLMAGTYTVQVRDQRNQIVQQQVTLQEPPAITAVPNVTYDQVSISASGGTGALTFSLNGTDFQAGSVFDQLANGSYTAFVRDDNHCLDSVRFVIAVEVLRAGVTQKGRVSCFGVSDASLEVMAMGGVPPYQYNLNGGVFRDSSVFSGLGAGLYKAGVRDARNTVIYSDFTVAQPDSLRIKAVTDQSNMVLSAVGGTPPYLFSLNGDTLNMTVLSGLAEGWYKAEVLDRSGCVDSVRVLIRIIDVRSPFETGSITIYPNPGHGLYMVEVPPSLQLLSVQISDAQGRLVFRRNNVQGAFSVDIRGLPAGTYFLQGATAHEARTFLIIKQ